MFKYFKKRKDVKTAQAAYSQESREYFKLTQELEDAQKELKTLESEWMNGLDYGRSKRFDRFSKQRISRFCQRMEESMNYLSNAFSIQMLDTSVAHNITITPIEPGQIPADAVSAIGHADTAAVVSDILCRSVPCNRMNVRLTESDTLYVAQLTGGRLPEGSMTLPEGFQIAFLKVQVQA